MKIELTQEQKAAQAAFRTFSEAQIVPNAAQYDQDELTPPELIRQLAEHNYLGALVPKAYGGLGMDMITFALLNEEIGRACSSVRSLLTVHSMVSAAILRWGSRQQKQHWLPKLASGEVIGAFALTEPNVGSDASSVQTSATKPSPDEGREGDHYLLNGQKKWITYGQIADLFLVFAHSDGKSVAFLVERERAGLSTEPIRGMLGTRGSMLAQLYLNDCLVPKENMLARPGFGLMAVASSALDIGRLSVACGCVGIGQACLEASLRYAASRHQFGVPIKDHQLIRQLITNMITNVKAARLLCYQAGYLKDQSSPNATQDVWIAKYFASTMAVKVANDAVQLHGANGCSSDYPVQRYLRDAKIMEIIEGSTQIQQIFIAENAFQTF